MEKNDNMQASDFSYHSIDKNKIVIDKYSGLSDMVIVPAKISGQLVGGIGERAFANNRNIEYIILPDTVEEISEKAFWSCRRLQRIALSKSLRKIGDYAFAECESLKHIKIQHPIEYLGKNAFTLSGIEVVELAGVTDWKPKSFSLCSKLATVMLKNVTNIPDECFAHDIYLDTVISDEPICNISKNAFKDCRRFERVEIEHWELSKDDNEILSEEDTLGDLLTEPKRLFRYIRVILKNSEDLESGVVLKKANRLYKYLSEHSIKSNNITSILPADITKSIIAGKLPIFPHDDIGISIEEDEIIYFVDHAMLYKEVSEEQFVCTKGKLYLFSNKIGFYGSSDNFEILTDNVDVILQYDGQPEIIEFITYNNNFYLEVPNVSVLFAALHNLENMDDGKETETVETGITLEKMIEGAELDSYIFYFEDVQHSKIDEKIKNHIGFLIEKLQKLNEALKKHPDNKEGTHRFSTYYLPETLRLIFSYQQYLNAGVSQEKTEKVYDKVLESIETVIRAVEKKIDDIYQVATMNTVAKANALQKIIGQDGYTKGDGPLKH